MQKTTQLRWGILGAARINQRLLPAIVEASNSQLVAIASRRPGAADETLRQYAPQQKDIRIDDNPEQLLSDPNIQAIYCPMANEEHTQWVLRAIEHNKHVLCEKPLALTVADIDKIESAAKIHQVKVMEGFMYRFHPQINRILELIHSGIIGDIRSVRSCFSFMLQPARLYRMNRNIENGGGAMWDIGCYAIHTLRTFFNQPPLAVSAMANYAANGADISNTGILDFDDGKYACFNFSFEQARRSEYEIIGTRGGLKCHTVWLAPQGDSPVISWWTEAGQQCEEKLPPANHFRLEIEHFSDCVLNDKAPLLTLEDAKNNCRTIVAALKSAACGERVKIAQ